MKRNGGAAAPPLSLHLMSHLHHAAAELAIVMRNLATVI